MSNRDSIKPKVFGGKGVGASRAGRFGEGKRGLTLFQNVSAFQTSGELYFKDGFLIVLV